jgi:hypothetical protein
LPMKPPPIIATLRVRDMVSLQSKKVRPAGEVAGRRRPSA